MTDAERIDHRADLIGFKVSLEVMMSECLNVQNDSPVSPTARHSRHRAMCQEQLKALVEAHRMLCARIGDLS